MEDLKFEPNDSFDDAMKTFKRFLEDHREEGPMALISMARAMGAIIVIGTSHEERSMALATIIEQLCNTYTDLLHLEREAEDD